MRLVEEIRRYGPQYVRDARRAHGDDAVDKALRTHQVKRYRLPDGHVLILGRAGRRALGMPVDVGHPSVPAVQQQVTRGAVIRALETRGYHLLEHRDRHLSVMTGPNGARALVAVNRTGYTSETLRRLVGKTLYREALQGCDIIVVTPHPERLENAAKDHKALFTLEDLKALTGPPTT